MVIHRLQRTPMAQIFLSFTGYTGFQPNAGFPGRTFAFQSIFSHRKYNDFFQVAQVPANIGIKFFQVKHGVTH